VEIIPVSKRELNRLEILPSFVNTREFSREALNFLDYGYYTNAPEGTITYKEYWDEQRLRCLEGYSVGGVHITGRHYFYLNFTQIKATEEVNGRKTTRLKFPRFLDMDYYYFQEIENAWANNQGMIVGKSRRKGFSYKNAGLCAHMYTFERDSTSIIGAYLKELAKLTMDMTLTMLNFLNEHTAFRKRRDPDRHDFVKSRWLETKEDGTKVWKGTNSEIFSLTFKDNFSSAIGKKASLFLFEEAGKWPNLLETWGVTQPTFMDGAHMIGMPIIFGTGGDMEGGTADFAAMFDNPTRYGLRPFDNVWDEGRKGSACGLFIDDMWYKPGDIIVPKSIYYNPELYKTPADLEQYKNDTPISVPMVDGEGNSNRKFAEIYLDLERQTKKEAGGNQVSWEKFITQYPKTPREAFLRTSGNKFPTAELNEHLGRLETDADLRSYSAGELAWGNNGLEFRPTNISPILKYPHEFNEDNTGAVVIWEHPYKDVNGNIPHGLYIAGTDPYDQDDSTTMSLGSTFIYKTFQSFDQTYNILVAEYTGRPRLADEYYENVRKLLSYYNARTLYENQLKGMQTYFRRKKCLHLMAEQPGIIDKSIKNSKVHRGYGIHMPEQIKRDAEIYLRDWLLEERGTNEDGAPILNLHTLRSIPLVQELIAYDPSHGNFDRAIALMLVALHMKEKEELTAKAKANTRSDAMMSGFFSPQRKLFSKNRK
jgi:hypothetical protein